MASQKHINTFDKGMNKDVSSKLSSNNTYRSAKNVELRSNGDFFSLKNIKGTSLATTLFTDPSVEFSVMAIADSNYYIPSRSSVERCSTIFAAVKDASGVYMFNIYVYNPIDNNAFLLYSKTVSDNRYFNESVDYQIDSEGGVDSIYFTNNIDPLGKIRCVYGTLLTDRDIELLRRYPSGNLNVSSILYNPVLPPSVSNQHTLSLGNKTYGTDSPGTSWEAYTYDLILDNDTTTGNTFEYDVLWHYNANLRNIDANPSTSTASVKVELRDGSGTLVINENHSINLTGAGTTSISDSGTYTCSGGAIYNGAPYSLIIRIDLVLLGDQEIISGMSSADFSITSIRELTGGEAYRIGSPALERLTSTAWL